MQIRYTIAIFLIATKLAYCNTFDQESHPLFFRTLVIIQGGKKSRNIEYQNLENGIYIDEEMQSPNDLILQKIENYIEDREITNETLLEIENILIDFYHEHGIHSVQIETSTANENKDSIIIEITNSLKGQVEEPVEIDCDDLDDLNIQDSEEIDCDDLDNLYVEDPGEIDCDDLDDLNIQDSEEIDCDDLGDLYIEDSEEIKSEDEKTTKASFESPTSEPRLQTLVLVQADIEPREFSYKLMEKGLYIDDSIHFSKEILTKAIEPLINCEEISEELILTIKNAIINCYHAHGQYLVAVEIPEQNISSNVLTLEIIEPIAGNVIYTGNRWFSDSFFKSLINLEPYDWIDEDKLLNDVAWLNQNPFHFSEVILSPGYEKGTSDIEIYTKDKFPLKLYFQCNNNGTESTGVERYTGGMMWGNAFFNNDIFSFQFTSNSHFNRFNSYTLSYTSYLSSKNSLSIYGGYAKIEPDSTPNFKNHGKDAQISFRYKAPFLPLYTRFDHQMYYGFDYKYFNSALFFIGELTSGKSESVPIQLSNVNVTNLMVGYQLESIQPKNQLSFVIEFYGSPVEWLPHQNSKSYSKLRPNAKPCYIYSNLSFGNIYTFTNNFSTSLLLRVQATPNTLIPSEQFAFGGFDTVRGYENNAFISDNAVCANIEFRTKPFNLFKKIKDQLIFLAFVDYGWGYNYHAFDGIVKSATLLGVGPGIRYNIDPYLTLRVDYGFRLNNIPFDSNGLGFCHAGLTLSY